MSEPRPLRILIVKLRCRCGAEQLHTVTRKRQVERVTTAFWADHKGPKHGQKEIA